MKKKSRNISGYRMSGNLFFVLVKAWQMDKPLMIAALMQVPVLVLLPLCTTYLSSCAVRWIGGGMPPEKLAQNVLILSGALLLFHLADKSISAKTGWGAMLYRMKYLTLCSEKAMDMDYENLENPEGRTRMQRAMDGLYESGGTQEIFRQLVSMGANIIGLVTYSALIADLSLWLVVLLAIMTVAAYFVNRADNAWN